MRRRATLLQRRSAQQAPRGHRILSAKCGTQVSPLENYGKKLILVPGAGLEPARPIKAEGF